MVNRQLVSAFKSFRRHRRYFFASIIGAVLFLLFSAQIKALIIITVLGFAATFSTYYKKVFAAPPVFELMTLTIALVSVFYGPLIGLIYAGIVSLTAEIASQALDPFSITYVFPRIVTAIVAPHIYHLDGTGVSVAVLGVLMSLLYNALQQPVYWALTDPEKRIKSVYFAMLNIPINFLLFKFLGEPLFAVLRAAI